MTAQGATQQQPSSFAQQAALVNMVRQPAYDYGDDDEHDDGGYFSFLPAYTTTSLRVSAVRLII